MASRRLTSIVPPFQKQSDIFRRRATSRVSRPRTTVLVRLAIFISG